MVKLDLIVLFVIAIGFCSTTRIIVAQSTEMPSYSPIETQRAECTLISGDVRASAEASVSRKLEGFCATEHLSRAFANLEYRVLTEINHLRSMINLLLPPLYQQHYFAQPEPQLYQPLPSPPSNTSNVRTVQSIQTDDTKLSPVSEPSQPSEATLQSDQIQNESPFDMAQTVESPTTSIEMTKEVTTVPTEEPTEPVTMPTEKLLEFKPVQKKERNKIHQKTKTGPREFEINKLNNTIQWGADLQIFTYYWKIEQFSVKLKSNISTISSPIFAISGLYLRVTAELNHLGRELFYLQLEQVSAEKATDKSNIILKTGDLFKKIQTKVHFMHKIVILDQVTPTSDLISQEFANTSQGFLVPISAIQSNSYSKGDNVLIKIVINL